LDARDRRAALKRRPDELDVLRCQLGEHFLIEARPFELDDEPSDLLTERDCPVALDLQLVSRLPAALGTYDCAAVHPAKTIVAARRSQSPGGGPCGWRVGLHTVFLPRCLGCWRRARASCAMRASP